MKSKGGPVFPETQLISLGRDVGSQRGFVNPPIIRGSTVLYQTAEDLRAFRGEFLYGRVGTPTTHALCDALRVLEGPTCAGVGLAPSGLAAISTALLALLKAGDHILVADNIYQPTRLFCDNVLTRYGVKVQYFDPLIGAAIEALFEPATRAVVVEAPGSQTFEMPDIPAIAAVAHRWDAFVMDDNTWATSLLHRSLECGADVSIQSGTKYLGGHADAMFGAISANARAWPLIQACVSYVGTCVAPEDTFLILRGLRTLSVRLKQHERSALELARWLLARPEVDAVLHPGLESDPGHSLWKRDFKGSSGLFSIVLKPVPEAAVNAMLNALELFGMGYSWGGFESLILPFNPAPYRTATEWSQRGPALRIHVGLENVEDLKSDLENGLRLLDLS